ncbi:hypothetical protein V6N11_039234 [Hibiscus sabdariffa]|uniref:Uncharacterized protein n=1 Tax=Hibiscus sabdariffa TaxID=183260 RepID=A0ABR2SN32_9ROSI
MIRKVFLKVVSFNNKVFGVIEEATENEGYQGSTRLVGYSQQVDTPIQVYTHTLNQVPSSQFRVQPQPVHGNVLFGSPVHGNVSPGNGGYLVSAVGSVSSGNGFSSSTGNSIQSGHAVVHSVNPGSYWSSANDGAW